MLRRQARKAETPASLLDRLRRSIDEMDSARLQERFSGLALTSIDQCPERVPARIGGEVRGQRLARPGTSPWLEVTISDGTGTAVAHFSGRRHVGGMEAGRAVVVEGVGRRERGVLILRDPAYALLP